MQDQKTATLATTFSEVLANLAFMFTDEDLADPPSGDVWFETTIHYSGPAAGTLRLRCTADFSVQLAASLLGIAPDNADAEQGASDAVKEFMNIVCGQFVTAAYGTEGVFNVTIPEISELSDVPDLTVCVGVETCVVSVDDQFVQLSHLPDGTR